MIDFGRSVLLLAFLTVSVTAFSQQTPDPEWTLLWQPAAPGAQGDGDVDQPAVRIYLPPQGKAVGAAVIVCPGGGYGHLALDHEGSQIAVWLNSLGIAAFVLRYRLGPKYHHPIELGDAQRALRYVRSKALGFGVSPNRIGIWGFSAGGHLASTAGTHFDSGNAGAADPIDRVSWRPDFMILAYPVITSLPEFSHKGSFKNLLGAEPDPKLMENLSNERQITAQTPPTFLFHTNEDTGVPAENSVMFYLALRKAGVPAELHIFERGRHGVGLAPSDPVLSAWPARLADWLKVRGLLTPAPSVN